MERLDALEECHGQLARILGPSVEPIEVWRCAEEHRAYWRPKQVRVLLLAESHVYTSISEVQRHVSVPNSLAAGMPPGFVRLVYCLGYGENRLLDRPIATPQNSGTWQFWKIFYSCTNRVRTNEDFSPILKGKTSFPERIRNKIALLRRLQEKGVWLVDTSLAALSPRRPTPATITACLRTSWDVYVGQVVRDAAPSHIICIGKGVSESLGIRLRNLGIRVTEVFQPNARGLTSTDHFDMFRQYYDTVSRSSEEQAPARIGGPAPLLGHSSRPAMTLTPSLMGVERSSATSFLVETAEGVPPGAKVRTWTLREDNNAHFHGVVRFSESPLYLELSWRPSAMGQVTRVGLFKLNLHGLLEGRYVRHNPVGSNGPELRLRIVRAADGLFYIQARRDSPRIELAPVRNGASTVGSSRTGSG